MRIGFYTPSWPGEKTPNGITTATQNFVAGLEAAGTEAFVLAAELDGEDARGVKIGAPRPYSLLEKLHLRMGGAAPLYQANADAIAAGVRRLVETRGIDAFVMEESFGWAARVQRAVSIPVAVFLHGPYFIHQAMTPLQRGLAVNHDRDEREGEAVRSCAAVLAPSQSVLDATLAHYRCDPKWRHVAPNPIRVKTPVRAETFEEACLPILFVGRFDTLKGGDIALEAVKLLAERGVDFRLTFVGPDIGVPGSGGQVLQIETALAALPAAARERIDYLGPKPKAEIDRLRLDHPAAIVPSRYETFGITVTEAMASGAAVVASDAGGIPEILDNRRTGLLIPPENPAALADVIESLAQDRELARGLGAAAREDIGKRFSPEAIAGDLAGFLEKVAAEQKRAH